MKRRPSSGNTTTEVDRQLDDTAYDNVVVVKNNITDVIIVADAIIDNSFTTVLSNTTNIVTTATNIGSVNTTAASIANINVVAADLLEPISEIDVVATNIANVNTVGNAITNVNIVATNVVDINSVATAIVPNIAEILLADTNAITATTQAGIATTKASEASVSAAAALASELSTASLLDQFDDRYLGSKSTEPLLDNDGNVLLVGALYFDSVVNCIRVYGSDLLWSDALTLATGSISTLTNKTLDSITNQVGANHIHYKVRNNSASIIPLNTVVTASGTQPGTDYINVLPITDPQTQMAIGVVHTVLAVNGSGLVINTGVADDVDTSAWTVGTLLYPNTTGGFTTVRPTTGRYQTCSIVLRQHATQGTLLCEFTNPVAIASTTQSGYVQLNDTLTSTSVSQALTAAQGKVLQDATEKKASKGAANGYAPLDSNAQVPAINLPSYVDDVLEYATKALLPTTGVAGIIYIVVADESAGGNTSTYRWTGTIYALISDVMTATDILNLVKTVDGTTSGLDADLLDGMNADSNPIVNTIVARNASGSTTLTSLIIDNGIADGGELLFKSLGNTGISIDNLSGTLRVFDTTELLKVTSGTGALLVKGQATINGGAITPWIELGTQDTVAETPFIDFHSGTTATDFDSRIIASGGTASSGGGTLTFQAASSIFANAYASTATVGTNTTQIATTEFVNAEIANDTFSKTELTMAIGNINSPLLDMPLKNSLAMRSGVGSATFTRTTTATYIDRYGVLKTSAIDEPRFEKEGYLNEGASTNLLLQSEDFSTTWITYVGTTTPNTTATTDPYGTNLAEKYIASGAGGRISQNSQAFALESYITVSVFAKKEGVSNYLRFEVINTKGAWFNLSTGVISNITASTTAIMTPLSNGWYRCSISFLSTGITTALCTFYPTSTTGTSSIANDSVYIFGAQLEALQFATSYIPTVASTVTRAADLLNITRAGNLPNLEVNGELSVLLDFDTIASSSYTTEQNIFGNITSGTDKYMVSIINGSGNINSYRQYYLNSVDTTVLSQTKTVSPNTKIRMASTLNNTYEGLYLNGALANSRVRTGVRITQTQNSAISTTRIGGYSASSTTYGLFGHISNIRIWDKALTAQEMALA